MIMSQVNPIITTPEEQFVIQAVHNCVTVKHI